jgi:exonuclease SbcC
MLESLQYEVTFPTGRALKADIDFADGLTAISGSNEAGKSMILEMIRFCLWGSKALRGASSDYKTLKAQLRFAVCGERYWVVRTINKATLHHRERGGIASGTTAVNAKIIEIFGYDMRVFDVANNIGQGEVEALGNMMPSQRKAMVDQTIGLNVLDELIKWLSNQADAERKTYEALEGTLIQPVAPVPPVDYRPSAEIRGDRVTLASGVALLHHARGWLAAHAGLSEPAPVECKVTETAAELRAHQAKRGKLVIELTTKKNRLELLRPGQLTHDEIDKLEQATQQLEAYKQARAELARWPVPTFTSVELEDFETAHYAKQLEEEIAKLEQDKQECPLCGGEFAHDHRKLSQKQAELERLEFHWFTPLAGGGKLPDKLPTLSEIKRHRDYLYEYAAKMTELDKLRAVECPQGQIKSAAEIAELRRMARDAVLYKQLDAEIDGLGAELYCLPDRAADLEERIRYDAAHARYLKDKAAWDAYIVEKADKEAAVAELAPCEPALQELDEHLERAVAYENALAAYQTAKAAFDATKAKVDAAKANAERYERARRAMRALKVNIKAHLVPSLNKVASNLLAQMTNYQRNDVAVDEDFDIKIDGQPLHTLSGSGKAVANLAIRIALGQVLTNKVFSVLMGDEIDASMDENRAGYTAECLERLTGSIRQVLLVSHKKTDAEHHIQVG